MNGKILAVDDEAFNLDIIRSYLEDAGFEVVTAQNGRAGLDRLETVSGISAVVLDRMMPGMDGMEFLRRFRQDERFQDVPVVMQTAAASSQQIMEGIQAGAYYYLTKPYEGSMLVNIVRAACEQMTLRSTMREEVRKHKYALGLMQEARFRFRTLEESQNLAYFIASCFAEPVKVVYGLSELLINAVEHGNLGITYAEKSQLVRNNSWNEEVKRRLCLPQNADKFAYLTFTSDEKETRIRILDTGAGFDWKPYLEISPDRATCPHGRGIAVARMLSFDRLEYQGRGNDVTAIISHGG